MLDDYGDVLTVNDICKILDICKTTAYKWLNSNGIPHRRIGTRHFIAKEQLIKWLSNDEINVV